MKMINLNNRIQPLLVFLLITVHSGYGQDILFKVIASSGKCTLQHGSSAKWENLKTGEQLTAGDKVKLNESDYLGLMNSRGKSVELKNPGTYEINELAKNALNTGSDLERFAGYVLKESLVSKKKSENMSTLGAVVRIRPGIIDIFFPQLTSVLNESLELKWYPSSPGDRYVFELFNEQNRTVFITETGDTSVTLDLDKFQLLPDVKYKWMVYNSKNPDSYSDTCCFVIYPEKRRRAIEDTLNILKNELDNNSAVDQLMLAGFYTQEDLIIDAAGVFEKILTLVPGVEEYINYYVTFLLKYGITHRAEILLKTN